jgi:hypothetical protein
MLELLKPKIQVRRIALVSAPHAGTTLEGMEPVFALWFGRGERQWTRLLCWR